MIRPLFIVALALMLFGVAHAGETGAPAKPLRVLLLFPGDLLQPWAQDQAANTKRAITAAVGRPI